MKLTPILKEIQSIPNLKLNFDNGKFVKGEYPGYEYSVIFLDLGNYYGDIGPKRGTEKIMLYLFPKNKMVLDKDQSSLNGQNHLEPYRAAYKNLFKLGRFKIIK